ncbi:MAG: hypothetical protein AB1597_02290 [Chloroflexota bacterium]
MSRYRGYGTPPPGTPPPRRRPRPDDAVRRGRSQVRWCKHCQIDVYTEVVQGWDNVRQVHTFTHRCPYCGRIIARETARKETGE